MRWFKPQATQASDSPAELIQSLADGTSGIFHNMLDMVKTIGKKKAAADGSIPPFKRKRTDDKVDNRSKEDLDKDELREPDYSDKADYKDPGNAVSDFKHNESPTNPFDDAAGYATGLTFGDDGMIAYGSLNKSAELKQELVDELKQYIHLDEIPAGIVDWVVKGNDDMLEPIVQDLVLSDDKFATTIKMSEIPALAVMLGDYIRSIAPQQAKEAPVTAPGTVDVTADVADFKDWAKMYNIKEPRLDDLELWFEEQVEQGKAEPKNKSVIIQGVWNTLNAPEEEQPAKPHSSYQEDVFSEVAKIVHITGRKLQHSEFMEFLNSMKYEAAELEAVKSEVTTPEFKSKLIKSGLLAARDNTKDTPAEQERQIKILDEQSDRIKELWDKLKTTYAQVKSINTGTVNFIRETHEVAELLEDKLRDLLDRGYAIPQDDVLAVKNNIVKYTGDLDGLLMEYVHLTRQMTDTQDKLKQYMVTMRNSGIIDALLAGDDKAGIEPIELGEKSQGDELTNTKKIDSLIDKLDEDIDSLIKDMPDWKKSLEEVQAKHKSIFQNFDIIDDLYEKTTASAALKHTLIKTAQEDENDPESRQDVAMGGQISEQEQEAIDYDVKWHRLHDKFEEDMPELPPEEIKELVDEQLENGENISPYELEYSGLDISELPTGKPESAVIADDINQLQLQFKDIIKDFPFISDYDFGEGKFSFKDTSEKDLKTNYLKLYDDMETAAKERDRLTSFSIAIEALLSQASTKKDTEAYDQLHTTLDAFKQGINGLTKHTEDLYNQLRGHDYNKLSILKSTVAEYQKAYDELKKKAKA